MSKLLLKDIKSDNIWKIIKYFIRFIKFALRIFAVYIIRYF